MRTIEELEREIVEATQDYVDEHDQDSQYDAGMKAGFKAALRLTKEGKTPDEIFEYAQTDQKAYVSHGDDYADAWQSGYTCALEWAAEQFDWNKDGEPIFREGNKLGFPATKPKIEIKQFGGMLPKRDE